MHLNVEVRKNTYYDSVALMLISKEVSKMPDIIEVLVGMGTDLNKELAENLGLANDAVKELGVNDFFISVLMKNEDAFQSVIDKVNELLNQKKESLSGEYNPPTFDSAVKLAPDSNLVLISLPGAYAFGEAKKALERGMHVMLFSDNVSVEEEKTLKELGKEMGLLVMGPDCGTAIINNVPLAFANVIKKGSIGIVGASGTGTQEVSVIIDKLGGGVSQVIGTGGRDLSKDIGGIMMMESIKALSQDPETKVIVLISKPPAAEIAEKVLALAKESGKPFVVDFIGGDPNTIEQYGGIPGYTLEDTAYKAVALSKGEEPKDMLGFNKSEEEIEAMIEKEIGKLQPEQKYLRGIYTGGTLCDEAMKLLFDELNGIYSNIPLKPEFLLKDIHQSQEHTCIDLGDDMFTVGKAHPMIDPSERLKRLMKEAKDESVAVILMDFVLGYGAHSDPVGEMLPAIEDAQKILKERGKEIIWVASICGTEGDPQNLEEQGKKLMDAGFLLMPSNAQAVRLVSRILRKIS
ncbi:acyl-CoA synthetase FdrA [Alkaliphilus oremlandii]|uniref:FdrA family protein n=1 Tax=Alkaliphilus oremlandii (strain OhILAs) TaxID=350688 RepID=A8MET9_ALKOO|nr:acyl-CoA synthetase FdrA [Alkaliphilus oremlandii]ABW18418.1 FdrA family protein [Alkaliphilus oremlandii OhILAs]